MFGSEVEDKQPTMMDAQTQTTERDQIDDELSTVIKKYEGVLNTRFLGLRQKLKSV